MTIQDRAATLRALRAYLNIGQADVAAGAGVGRRSVWQAEAGEACTDRTWTAVLAYFASRGLIVDQSAGLSILIGENDLTNAERVARIHADIDQLAARLAKFEHDEAG